MRRDVLVVGAGPTGLAMAIELLRQKVPVRLIDRAEAPARYSQALGVQARTLEQFERYGIAERAVAAGRKIEHASVLSGGKKIVSLDFKRIPGDYNYVLLLPQSETERILTEHLESLGGRIERGTELVSFETGEEGVRAELRTEEGGREQWISRWLVGCDGAHSAVRDQLKIQFMGKAVEANFLLADVELEGPDAPGDELRVYLHGGDVVFIGRLTEKLYRVIAATHADARHEERREQREMARETVQYAGEVKLEDVQRALDGAGVRVRASAPVWMTPFRVNQRKVEYYREGNSFLAGDAAHIHSPVGGQGMNTGIQDAANLGWKIAAVMDNGAFGELLDSYNDERGEVGEALLKMTSRGLAAATASNRLVDAVRDMFMSLASHTEMVQKMMAGFISETAIYYGDSPMVEEKTSHRSGSLHAGDRMPNPRVEFGAGQWTKLLEPLRDGKHLLIGAEVEQEEAFRKAAPRANAIFLTRAKDAPPTHGRMNVMLDELFGEEDGGRVAIVRPDGYVGLLAGGYQMEAIERYAMRMGLRGSAEKLESRAARF